MPYLGFYGDWGKAPIFDALASVGGAYTWASISSPGLTGASSATTPLSVKQGGRPHRRPELRRYVISRSTARAPTILELRMGNAAQSPLDQHSANESRL